jgi:hypothetical protein
MGGTIDRLNDTLNSLIAAIEENIALFSRCSATEEKRKIAEIIQFLSASQKNITESIDILSDDPLDGFNDDFDDDDDVDFDDFMGDKQIDFKSKKKKGKNKGKKISKHDDDDVPF